MRNGIRERAGTALLRFATERSLERQDIERQLEVAGGPGSPGYAGAMAAMSAARCFESAMLWVGWRLSPARGLLSDADISSY